MQVGRVQVGQVQRAEGRIAVPAELGGPEELGVGQVRPVAARVAVLRGLATAVRPVVAAALVAGAVQTVVPVLRVRRGLAWGLQRPGESV